jgi:oligosaccharide repeat unit polymerase
VPGSTLDKPLQVRPRIMVTWLVLVALGIGVVAVALLFGSGGRSSDRSVAGALVWVTIVVSVLFAVAALVQNQNEPGRFLHPLVAPLAYLVYALLVPLAFISVTGKDIEYMPSSMLNPRTAAAMALTVAVYCISATVTSSGTFSRWSAQRMGQRSSISREAEVGLVTRDIGRLVLVLALAAQVYEWIVAGPVSGRTYGADQLAYGVDTAIAVFGESLVGVGCLLTMRGNALALRKPLTRFDAVLIVAVCGIGLFILGSRAEAIAPVILFVWFWIKSGRKISAGPILVGLAAMAALFLIVAQIRTHSVSIGGGSLISSLLVETSSPVFLTNNVIQVMPAHQAFLNGSTYFASLEYMLPGPIARALFGAVSGTGTLAYREIINFTYSGQGWGFSLPTEGYVNFGFPGVLGAGAFLGGLFGSTYKLAQRDQVDNRIGSYIYPLLISYLPFGIRTDALGEMKSVIYPIIICYVALWLAKWAIGVAERRVSYRATFVS